MQRILSTVRKAVDDYNMIQDGDKIAVGVSGGKDSITLLLALNNLKLFYPNKFSLIAVSIDPGFDNFNTTYLQELCNTLKIEYFIENSHIKEIVFDIRKEKNPCSLCANLRRGILNSIAIRENCNKIALGHNKEDVLETFFLNLIYAGKIHTFSPVSFMERANLSLIRPLIYTEEKEIRRFIKKQNIQTMNKCCPMDGYSKREDMKALINSFYKDLPNVKNNLLGAIKRNGLDGWGNNIEKDV